MLSDRRHSYIHKYESNASMLSRVIFYLKSVTFLFLFSIYIYGGGGSGDDRPPEANDTLQKSNKKEAFPL